MEKKLFCGASFWFEIEDAGLNIDDVTRLMVEVPKTPRIIDTVVYKGNKKFVFKNYGSHIDCLVEGVMIQTLYRLVK